MKSLAYMAVAVGLLLVLDGGARAMEPATAGGGLNWSPRMGAAFGDLSGFAAAGSLSYGIKTGLLGSAYTNVFEDDLSASNTSSSGASSFSMGAVGVMQPLSTGGSTAVAGELGLGYADSQSFDTTNNTTSSSTRLGFFIGGRGTLMQNGGAKVNAELRYYHISGASLLQIGAGWTGPINKRLEYTVDYDRLQDISGGGGANIVSAGVRWFIPTGPGQKQ